MNVVSFPGLGLELEINRVAFSIGGFQVYWYGMVIGIGMLLAIIYAFSKTKKLGINDDRFIDVIIVSTIIAVIGARAYYVIFSEPGQFTSFKQMIDIRDGGMAFYGAVIAAFASAFFMCRWRRVKFLPALDIASMGFLIGQGFGRWGNFFNQECFGTNTDLPWGMTSSTVEWYLRENLEKIEANGMTVDPALPVHPTFLYESLWCFLGFAVLAIYLKHRKFDGEIALIYLAWNGVGRAVIEGLRTDSLYFGSIRISQLLAAVGAVLSIALIVFIRIKMKKSGNSDYLKPYGQTEEWAKECALEEEKAKEQDEKLKKIKLISIEDTDKKTDNAENSDTAEDKTEEVEETKTAEEKPKKATRKAKKTSEEE